MNTDERIKSLITHIGDIEFPLRENFYESLIRSINGQLLSVKVADIIHFRLVNLLGAQDVTPNSVAQLSNDALREIGISERKVSYIRDLTDKILREELILEELSQKEDQEVLDILTSIKGIGEWTAEMFLLFSLGRKDVLALKDIGLQRGAKWLYQLESNQAGLEKLKEKSEHWKPYRTIPSIYLWEVVTRNYIHDYENISELTGT